MSTPFDAEQREREAFYADIRHKLGQEFDWAHLQQHREHLQQHREENERQWAAQRDQWNAQRGHWRWIYGLAIAALVLNAIVRVLTS